MARRCPLQQGPHVAISFLLAIAAVVASHSGNNKATPSTARGAGDSIWLIQQYVKKSPRLIKSPATPLEKKLQEALNDPDRWQRHGPNLRKVIDKLFKESEREDNNHNTISWFHRDAQNSNFVQDSDANMQQLREETEKIAQLDAIKNQLESLQNQASMATITAQLQQSEAANDRQSPLLMEYQKMQQYTTFAYNQNQQLHQILLQMQERNSKLKETKHNLTVERIGIQGSVKHIFDEHDQLVKDNKRLKLEIQNAKTPIEELEAQRGNLTLSNKMLRGKFVQFSSNLSKLIEHVHQVQSYSKDAYAENQVMRNDLSNLTADKQKLENAIDKINVDEKQWRVWLKRLTDWNAKLQTQVQSDLPENVKTELAESIRKVEGESKYLMDSEAQKQKDAMTLDDGLAKIHKQIKQLKWDHSKLISDREKAQIAYQNLIQRQKQMKASIENITNFNQRQSETISQLHSSMDESSQKASAEKQQLQTAIAQINEQEQQIENRLSQVSEDQHKLLDLQVEAGSETKRPVADTEEQTHDRMSQKSKELETNTKQITHEEQQLEFDNDKAVTTQQQMQKKRFSAEKQQPNIATQNFQLSAASASGASNSLEDEIKRLASENSKIRDQLWDNFAQQQELLDNTKNLEQDRNMLRETVQQISKEKEDMRNTVVAANPANLALTQLNEEYTKLKEGNEKLIKDKDDLNAGEQDLQTKIDNLVAKNNPAVDHSKWR